jgi:uncharacterized protein
MTMDDRSPNAQRAPFPRRDLDLNLDPAAVPRYWYGGDPFLTLFWEGLSLLFPRGERFFVDSVRAHRDRVADPALAVEVAGFIGQEAMHGREHRAFNELLRDRGGAMNAAIRTIDSQLAAILGGAQRTLSPASQLAVTCALEHFTAIMAEQLLDLDRHAGAIDPSVRPLWLWHALEESEHRAVAFDVYRASGGGYLRRAAIMLVTTAIFIAEATNVHLRLLRADRSLWRPRSWLRGLAFFWGRPGLFRRMIPAYLGYFRPRFHPHDRDVAALIAATRARLFGPDGELRDRVEEHWPAPPVAPVASPARLTPAEAA